MGSILCVGDWCHPKEQSQLNTANVTGSGTYNDKPAPNEPAFMLDKYFYCSNILSNNWTKVGGYSQIL